MSPGAGRRGGVAQEFRSRHRDRLTVPHRPRPIIRLLTRSPAKPLLGDLEVKEIAEAVAHVAVDLFPEHGRGNRPIRPERDFTVQSHAEIFVRQAGHAVGIRVRHDLRGQRGDMTGDKQQDEHRHRDLDRGGQVAQPPRRRRRWVALHLRHLTGLP